MTHHGQKKAASWPPFLCFFRLTALPRKPRSYGDTPVHSHRGRACPASDKPNERSRAKRAPTADPRPRTCGSLLANDTAQPKLAVQSTPRAAASCKAEAASLRPYQARDALRELVSGTSLGCQGRFDHRPISLDTCDLPLAALSSTTAVPAVSGVKSARRPGPGTARPWRWHPARRDGPGRPAAHSGDDCHPGEWMPPDDP